MVQEVDLALDEHGSLHPQNVRLEQHVPGPTTA